MKRTKRVLATILTLAMVLSLAGVASAADATVYTASNVFSDLGDTDCADAFTFLAGFGIYKGDEGVGGPARPDDPIKRTEFTAVVTRMLGAEASAAAMSGYAPSFADAADIPTWAWGYVNYAVAKGIIKGYEDGTFRPSNNVTHAEVLAMLLRAIGLDDAAVGTWPFNYIALAYEVDMDEDVDLSANVAATRCEVAILTYNAMTNVTEKWDKEDEELVDTGETWVERTGKYDMVNGVVASTSAADKEIELKDDDDSPYDLADVVMIVGASSLSALKNYEVNLYFFKDKVKTIEVVKEADTVSGTFWRFAERSGPKYYLELANGTLVRYVYDEDDGFDVTLDINGEDEDVEPGTDGWQIDALEAYEEADSGDAYLEVVVTLAKSSGVFYAAHIEATDWNITNGVLGDPDDDIEWRDEDLGVEVDNVTVTYPDGSSEDFDVDDDTSIKLNGSAAALSDLEENDVLKVAVASDGVAWKVEATRKTIAGEVDSISVKDGKTWVKIEKSDGSKVSVKLHDDLDAPVTGTEVEYGLNASDLAVVEITAVTPKPYLLVKGKSVVDGDYFYTVDALGTTVDYEVVDDTEYDAAAKGDVIFAEFDGKVIDGVTVLYDVSDDNVRDDYENLCYGEVFSASSSSTVIEVVYDQDLGLSDFVISATDYAVYAEKYNTLSDGTKEGNGKVGDYIGGSGLKKGDLVWFAVDPTGKSVFILKAYKDLTEWPAP